MLVTKEKATVTGDLAFSKKVEMSFDPAARNMQVRNAIRMYANPRLAALREYTSNARDAHKAAGHTGPVMVTLPTSLHPFLTIVDKGVGLSSEELEGFGQFGFTTKDGSNEYIGGFGLGSKSGLAVADQFTVISVKDGKKNVVVVGWDESGAPSLGFLDEQDTTEDNGTTIQIPSATGHGDWTNIAQSETFIGWERGSILINGKEPAKSVHDTTQYKRLNGGWLTLADRQTNRYYYGPDKIHALVHGVYYAIPSDKFGDRTIARILADSVLDIENGSVDILPSRDDLEWTDRTIAQVRKSAHAFMESIVAEYQEQIATVKTFRAAKEISDAMESIGLPTQGLTFKGILLDWSKDTDAAVTRGTVKSSTSAKSGWANDRVSAQTRNSNNVHRQYSILVTGCSGESSTGYYRKDQKFVNESSETVPFVVAEAKKAGKTPLEVIVYFTNQEKSALAQGFVSAMQKVIKVEDFVNQAKDQRKAWASDRAAAGAGSRPKATDRVLRTVNGYSTWNYTFAIQERQEQKIIAEGNPVVVLHSDDKLSAAVMEAHTQGTGIGRVRELMKFISRQSSATDTTFVILSKNHKASNLVIPNWKTLTDWLKDELSSVVVRTPMELAVDRYVSERHYQTVPRIDAQYVAKIEDKELREWMTAYVNRADLTLAETVAQGYPDFAPAQPEPSDYEPTLHYPLIDKISLGAVEGGLLVEYVNMVNSAR